jgi:hypothetical protein
MSSSEKSTNPKMEDIVYEDEIINKIFKGLDIETKNKLLKDFPYNENNKNIHVGILKNIADPKIKEIWKTLPEEKKQELDKKNIRDKYLFLREMVKDFKPKVITPLSSSESDSASSSAEVTPKEYWEQKNTIKSNRLNDSSKYYASLANKNSDSDIEGSVLTKIAIIIPFRDIEKEQKRTKQLNEFVKFFEKYLKDYKYKIFLVEQSKDGRKFNRGQLLNIGFEHAEKEGYKNFIFHDVDLLPSPELKEWYINIPKDKPVHIAAVWDRYGGNQKYFGGIVAFNKEMFERINGYPNDFWGWGGEDDELYKRTKKFYEILKVKKGSIHDLEELTLQQKLDYLRENDLKFMRKLEALERHEATWKRNGLNSLNYKELSTNSCGENCEKITVELDNEGNVSIENEEKVQEVPEDIFRPEFEEMKTKVEGSPQKRFDDLVKTFYDSNPFVINKKQHELEVKFGTKGVKPLMRNDYDNVIKKLKSMGFNTDDSDGLYSLRINCEFLDSTTGKFKMSDIRTEINGLHNIEEYCKSNDIKSLYAKNPTLIKFNNKKMASEVGENKTFKRHFPVDFDDFNFRVTYNTEEESSKGIQNFIFENWRKSKKEFRFINRVSFRHDDYPVIVDISIVKYANRTPDKYGRENRGRIIPVYTLDESNIFNNPESYEIEIEVDNWSIGPSTRFNSPRQIVDPLRKVIKYVLGGLQSTNYPISYPEQQQIIQSYMRLIWKDEHDPKKYVSSKNFIGPNSITLQIVNIAPIDENSSVPNIRKNFVVTDKADGDRHLMLISEEGKIYLINTNMDIIFTGAKTNNKDCFNTILDGELILHDKNGKYINLYAAFDVYFIKKQDVRSYTFMLLESEEDDFKARYNILKYIQHNLNPVSILDKGIVEEQMAAKSFKSIQNKLKHSQEFISPIRFTCKEFFPNNRKQSIFEGCDLILQKERDGRFEYSTDGLIFTHAFYGVGATEIGKAGPKTKITWEHSFKWKPPHYNTIDFLITTLKAANGDDVIKSYYEDGINTSAAVQYNDYKTIELRCGFKERQDGYINPCQDVIDDKLPEFTQRFEDREDNDYIPKRFYPTEPYDPNAGLCNIMLRTDANGNPKMFSEENEVFEDNTIVEFRYDLNKPEGWRWQPLRVRYDKTAKLRRGEKEYGNSYKVCNENWKSIHPSGRITGEMLCTGLNIPNITISEDKYYNTPTGKFKTEAMKDFHNLYIKRKLITGISKQGDTLIDFACGKAGDLPKWITAKLSFVFGVDISKDNLENRLDGACARFLNMKKTNKNTPYALFVNGNSAFNIKDGSAMLNEKAKQITSAVFGKGSKEADIIGKGVSRQYGRGADGFNVSSCQFAIHYFFETPETLKGFMKNIAECTKHNGYFIGTCYDGKLVFNELKKTKTNESIKIIENDKKIWEITKEYGGETFEDDSSSIGYRIDVYQESINQVISEYLVNFDYLNRVMSAYGFEIISHEEAKEIGVPDGSGTFNELFLNMLDEIAKNKFKAKDYDKAPYMSEMEKKISFLNRYFIYKKVRTVNTESVELELGEYQAVVEQRNAIDTKQAQTVAVEQVKLIKPKIRKLSKKMLLVAATEAIDENIQMETKKTEKPAKKVKKPLLIVESDDE